VSSIVDVGQVAVALTDDVEAATSALPVMPPVAWTVRTVDEASPVTQVDVPVVDVAGSVVTITVTGPALVIDATFAADDLLAVTAAQAEFRSTSASVLSDARLAVVPSGASESASGDELAAPAAPSAPTADAPVGGVTDARVEIALIGPGGVDSGERTFLLVMLVLAVILLVLAGGTVVAEARSLLRRARFDQLTGLPNRGEFEKRTTELLVSGRRTGSSVCILMFDLDGFKEINDEHGHRVGDEVLSVVAGRLRRAVRETDMVARWGGDEFVVVMPGIENVNLAQVRAATLAAQVTEQDVGPGLRIGVSVGVALFPLHGDSTEAMVEAADAAMYGAKRGGEVFRLADQPGSGSGDRPTLSV